MAKAASSNSTFEIVACLLFAIPHAIPHLRMNIHSKKFTVPFESVVYCLPEMSFNNYFIDLPSLIIPITYGIS